MNMISLINTASAHVGDAVESGPGMMGSADGYYADGGHMMNFFTGHMGGGVTTGLLGWFTLLLIWTVLILLIIYLWNKTFGKK